jgi:hypothetical protein
MPDYLFPPVVFIPAIILCLYSRLVFFLPITGSLRGTIAPLKKFFPLSFEGEGDTGGEVE